MRKLCLALMVVALSCAWDARAEASADEIQKWITQLGAEDFEAREKAEQALAKAGPAAIPLLKKALETADLETKQRGQRALEQLEWNIRPEVTDLLTMVPQAAIFTLQTPNLKAGVETLRKQTALGKLYDSPAFAPVKTNIGALFAQGMNMSAEDQELALNWLNRFGGPNAISFMVADKNAEWLEREQFGVFIGINDPNPDKAAADFFAEFPIRHGAAAQDNYRGVAYQTGTEQWNRDTLARIKNVIARTNTPTSLKGAIDRLMDTKTPGLAASPVLKEALGKVPASPLAWFFFNMESIIPALSDRESAEFEAVGMTVWKNALVTLQTKGDLMHEVAVAKVEGNRTSLIKLFSLQKNAARLAAACPQDALFFVNIAGEGKDIYEAIMAFSEVAEPNDTKAFRNLLPVYGQQWKVNIEEQIFHAVKGEAAFWMQKPLGAVPAPEMTLVIEMKDAASATLAADTLAKFIESIEVPQGWREQYGWGNADVQKRKVYYFAKPLDDGIPYTWSWCADGNRLVASTTSTTLKKLLAQWDAKAPGLDTAPDYQRVAGQIPADERGGLAYLNTAALVEWGTPLLAASISRQANQEFSQRINEAAKALPGAVKGFPGTVLTMVATADGAKAQSYGGLPVAGVFPMVPLLFFSAMRVHHAPAVMPVEEKAIEAPEAIGEPKPATDVPPPAPAGEKADATKKAAEPKKAEEPKKAVPAGK